MLYPLPCGRGFVPTAAGWGPPELKGSGQCVCEHMHTVHWEGHGLRHSVQIQGSATYPCGACAAGVASQDHPGAGQGNASPPRPAHSYSLIPQSGGKGSRPSLLLEGGWTASHLL